MQGKSEGQRGLNSSQFLRKHALAEHSIQFSAHMVRLTEETNVLRYEGKQVHDPLYCMRFHCNFASRCMMFGNET